MPKFTFETKLPLPETAEDLSVRLKHLFAIKDALDKEIEELLGRRTEERKPYHCVRCGHRWYSRLLRRPLMCPMCRTKRFDEKPAFTYEEKVARKKELEARRAQVVSSTPIPTAPMPHSVLTRQVSSENDSIQHVTLAPPPALDRPLTLRERLAQMASQPKPEPEPTPEPEPVIIEQSDDELVEAINNDDNDAA